MTNERRQYWITQLREMARHLHIDAAQLLPQAADPKLHQLAKALHTDAAQLQDLAAVLKGRKR